MILSFLCQQVDGVVGEGNLSVGVGEVADVGFGEVTQVGSGPDASLSAGDARLFQMAEYIRRGGEAESGYFFRGVQQV